MATLTMTPTFGGTMPRFPLSQPPRCNKCDNLCNREPRGKRFCYCCPCTGPQSKTWGTWDDAQGVQPGNPVCDCGFYCRVATNGRTGESFEQCAIGQCRMSTHKAQSPGKSPGRSPRARGPATGSYQASSVTVSTATTNRDSQVSAQISTQQTSIPVPAYSPPRARPQARIDNEFVRLLSHVMEATNRARMPTKVIDLTDMLRALPDGLGSGQKERSPDSPEPFRISYSTDFERHSKIGAAGELFMYLFLCRFEGGQMAWDSNMRNWIKQHPAFSEWPDWEGAETADIIFNDNKGDFTSHLVDNGYLDARLWRGQRPQYLVEVKSSLSNTNKEFYISSGQYARIQEYASPMPSSMTRPKIYMIARVSNLQDRDVGLQFYVDPETLRNSGKLRFKQVWAVEDLDA